MSTSGTGKYGGRGREKSADNWLVFQHSKLANHRANSKANPWRRDNLTLFDNIRKYQEALDGLKRMMEYEHI